MRLEQSSSIERFQSYTTSKIRKMLVQLCDIFHIFLSVEAGGCKCLRGECSLRSSKGAGIVIQPDGWMVSFHAQNFQGRI
jgi:hypothetical protein